MLVSHALLTSCVYLASSTCTAGIPVVAVQHYVERKGGINSLLIPRTIHQECGQGKQGSQVSHSVCFHHSGCKPAHPGEFYQQDLLRHLTAPACTLPELMFDILMDPQDGESDILVLCWNCTRG